MAEELLSEPERRAIALSAELANLLPEIVGSGPCAAADLAELYGALHLIQRSVASQAAARAYPQIYRLLGDSL